MSYHYSVFLPGQEWIGQSAPTVSPIVHAGFVEELQVPFLEEEGKDGEEGEEEGEDVEKERVNLDQVSTHL